MKDIFKSYSNYVIETKKRNGKNGNSNEAEQSRICSIR